MQTVEDNYHKISALDAGTRDNAPAIAAGPCWLVLVSAIRKLLLAHAFLMSDQCPTGS
jgi:hypothetical protein